MSSIDYEEPATLLTYDEDRVLPGATVITSLAEAIRTVVEEWSREHLVDVFIATPSRSVEGIEAVRAIYDRDDFPLPRASRA